MPRLDYFAPGVYVEEVSRGSRAIQGVNLSVAGFVGFTEDIRGDAELFQPLLITNWSQYLDNFAKVGSDGFTDFGAYLPFAIRGWFENGGGRCWVVSIGTQLPRLSGEGEPAEAEPDEDEVSIGKLVYTAGKFPSLEFRLIEPEQEDGRRTNAHRINVIIQSDEPPPSNDPNNEPFDTGEFFRILLQRDGKDLKKTVINASGEPEQVKAEYRHLTMQENPETGVFVRDALDGSEFIQVVIKAEQGLVLAKRPANGVYEVSPPIATLNSDEWYPKMYGNQKRRSGVQGLFEVDEVAMVACPDLMLAYERRLLNLDQLHGVMEMMITRCESSAPSPPYRMAVLDPPPTKRKRNDEGNLEDTIVSPQEVKPQDVETWLMVRFGRRSQFAALYYPWIQVPNPRESGKPIFVPPCGHMMGIWCRTDETRGIYKAPANEIPRGVIGLAYDTNFREQEFLNPQGINCIRKFRDRGTLVWGARTLAQKDDIDWRYISVRRIMSYIAKSIELGTQWAVFEPNDEDLWARVTRTVKNFLERIWREGALFGSSPDEAFYVKCDAELNTPETMKLGLLFVEVGVAPVRPAEFVIFRISQWDPTQDRG